jgi:MerC mercury resistance protein
MEKVEAQRVLDRLAISASALCIFHCLATPLLLVAVPVISATPIADERFHGFLLAFILPFSLVSLFLGCGRHKDRLVLVLGGLGLSSLVLIAFLGHDLLGELGERVATVVSGVIVAAGHLRNYRLCRRDSCAIPD